MGNDDFEYRDMGLAEASAGALGVNHIRAVNPDAAPPWQSADLDFDFLYVVRGTATLETSAGESHKLAEGTTVVVPPRLPRRLTITCDDFEAVRITAPAIFTTTTHAAVPPLSIDGGEVIISHETPDEYVRGNGPREYFLYRDLGTREPTDNRIHIHIVRATEPGPGTGWHYHTMAQWFLIIGGNSVITVEGREPEPLNIGDAMCVGVGPQMRHNVIDFTGDYAVLEMCIPAIYETIATGAPAGASG